MKIRVRSKSQVNIILLLFCMELCCCERVDRGSVDKIDFLYGKNNCEEVSGAFQEEFRCRCLDIRPSILSINTNKVQCLRDEEIDSNCAKTVLKVTNEATDPAKIKIISDCARGNIFQTEFWNMRSNDSYGYWHNEDDVKSYLALKEDGFLILRNKIDRFSGLFLRIRIKCEDERIECKLVKIDGFREYPIRRFAKSTTTLSSTTTTTTATTALTKETTVPKSESTTSKINPNTSSKMNTVTTKGSSTQKNINSSENKKKTIIIAAVAAVAILTIIILSICLWKRTCRKQKSGQESVVASTEQQNNYKSQPIYLETQKNGAYATFTDEYTTVTFNSSPKSDGPKPQYSELGLQYQDVKPVYSELSTDNQTYIDEQFYREVDETDRREFSQSSNVIYHTVEEEIPTYEENSYYSAVETLPDDLSNPAAVYAKVNK